MQQGRDERDNGEGRAEMYPFLLTVGPVKCISVRIWPCIHHVLKGREMQTDSPE
jgi:hypothetical protein